MAASSALLCLLLVGVCAAQTILPANITEGAVLRGPTPGVCPTDQQLESLDIATKSSIRSALRETVAPVLNCPCGGPGQWRKIAAWDFSDPVAPCPTGWSLFTSGNVRGCARGPNAPPSCLSANFAANGQPYSRVCGRINAYQFASGDAFTPAINDPNGRTIEQTYVDGVSLTYQSGGQRQHIWTFAVALTEDQPNWNPVVACPCTNTREDWPFQVPSFVGNNYFCATGNPGPGWQRQLYADDVLFDGQDCGQFNTCCGFNNPPWFCTTLDETTTSDVEMRVCHDQGQFDEDVIISKVDIFVM